MSQLGQNTREVARGASLAFVFRLAGGILTLAFNVILAQYLGAEGAGLYYLALSVVAVVAVIGRLGLDNALLRHVAAQVRGQNWGAVRGLYSTGIWTGSMAGTCLAVALFFASPWLADAVFNAPDLAPLLRVMSLAVVPVILFNLHAHVLLGLERTSEGVAVQGFWVPALLCLGVLLLVPYGDVARVTWVYVVAATVAAGIGVWRWRRAISGRPGPKTRCVAGELKKSSLPLFWGTVCQMVISLAPTILLGIWATVVDVGVFTVVFRLVIAFEFILAAYNSIACPRFSALYESGDLGEIQRVGREGTGLMLLAASPLVLLFVLGSEPVLFIVGSGFAGAGSVLAVLVVGQVFNLVAGPAGNVLMMCGYEPLVRNTLIFSALLSIMLCAMLIPVFGAIGAAWAFSINLAVENMIFVYLAWKKLGVVTVPFLPKGTVQA